MWHPDNTTEDDEEHEHLGVSLVSWNWDEVGFYLVPVVFLLLSGLAKLVFHHVSWLSARVPESCLLILVGLVSGWAIKQAGFILGLRP